MNITEDLYRPQYVVVGLHNEYDEDGSKHDIDWFRIHPDRNIGTFSNDIAVIKLKDRLKYTKKIRPICIGRQSGKVRAGQKVAAMKNENGKVMKMEEGSVMKNENGEVMKNENGEVMKNENRKLLKNESWNVMKNESGNVMKNESWNVMKNDNGKILKNEKRTVMKKEIGNVIKNDNEKVLKIVNGEPMKKLSVKLNPGENVSAMGWGTIKGGNRYGSQTLKHVWLEVISGEDCKRRMKNNHKYE